MAALDELARKKVLQSLVPDMTGRDSGAFEGGEQTSSENVNQDKEESKSEPIPEDVKATIARGVAGATPTLMGLLMGATPAMAETQMKETQRMFAAGAPSKELVEVVGPEGKPIYMSKSEAAGHEAYNKPTSTQGHTGPIQEFINTKTNEKVNAYMKDGVLLNAFTNKPIGLTSDWVKSYAPSTLSEKKLGGGRNHYILDKVTGKLKLVSSEAGVGDYVTDEKGNPIPEQEAKDYIKGMSSAKPKIAAIKDDITALERIVNVLTDPNANKYELKNAVETLKRTAGEKRLSDVESDRAEAKDLDSIVTAAEKLYSHRVDEVLTESERSGFSGVANRILGQKRNTVKSLISTYAPETKSKGKQSIKDRAFGESAVDSNEKADWKSKYKK